MNVFGSRTPNPPPPPAAFGAAEPHGLNVLVCDDERHIVRLIQVNLQRQGYNVDTAFDGQQCLERIRERCPDVLVLDLHMPKMGGREVMRILREDPETAGIKVILLSPKDEQDDDFSGFGPPPLVLCKPFNPQDLMRGLAW